MSRTKRIHIKSLLLGILLVVVCNASVFAQQQITIEKISHYFPVNDSLCFLKKNTPQEFISAEDSIIAIRILGYSSPEGIMAENMRLARGRAFFSKQQILKYNPRLTDMQFVTEGKGVDWEGLYTCVQGDFNTPKRPQIMAILHNAKSSDGLKAYFDYRFALMELGFGVWEYMRTNHFKYLRRSDVYISKYPFGVDTRENLLQDQSICEDLILSVDINEGDAELSSVTALESEPVHVKYVRPIAIKTNLLFDAVALPNVEVEIPIARRWSVSGEWIFPWWLWKNKQNCLQVLSGGLETRYWFRTNYDKQDVALGSHNPLAGWFAGVYGGGGLYDLEWKKKGYQGEFYIASGISAGYVKALNRNISLEFSVGVGVLKTKYRHYNAVYSEIDNDWHLMRQNNGSFFWVGPTKAKISIVWYPHFKYKR